MKRFVQLLLHFFAPFVGAMVGLFVTYQVEMTFLPVVTDFKLTGMFKVANGYQVTGSYDKRRSCELISTSLLAISSDPQQPAKLLHQLKHQDAGANLPVGLVNWGPYVFAAPASFDNATHIKAVSLHRCHALWLHQTDYITIPISALR